MNSTKLLLYSRRLHKWRCHRETIEEIKRLDALLEYAVMHEDEAEAAPRRAELTKLVEKV